MEVEDGGVLGGEVIEALYWSWASLSGCGFGRAALLMIHLYRYN